MHRRAGRASDPGELLLQIVTGYWPQARLGGGVQLSTGDFTVMNGNTEAVLVRLAFSCASAAVCQVCCMPHACSIICCRLPHSCWLCAGDRERYQLSQ